MSSEAALTKRVMAYLESLPGCHAEKRWGGGMGKRGMPDVSACYKGVRLEIELKVGRNKPTKLQEYQLRKWQEAGAVVLVARTLEEVQEAIRAIDREKGDDW